MKQIKETDKKTTIVLENGDILEIIALKGNKDKIIVRCLDTVLYIDEITKEELEQLQEEKKAIQVMKEYLEKSEKKN